MGDLVLGRLVCAVETSRSTHPRAWLPYGELEDVLSTVTDGSAERAGRDLIDRDVRVGPYRFVRSELSLATIDVLGPAIFRSYFSDPRVVFRATRKALELHWLAPPTRSAGFWALVDGMAKRLIELARVEAMAWSVMADDERRTLTAALSEPR